MIRVDYHDDLKEVQCDAFLVAALSAPFATAPFDRLEWWRNLADSFDTLPLIAIARDEQAGVALPLKRVKRRIELLACWYNFRTKPLYFGDDADGGVRHQQALSALARDLAGEAAHLSLSGLPDEQGETRQLAAALREAGWVVFVQQCDVNHILPVQGRDYGTYLARRPGQVRTTLKRKAAKVDVQLFSTFDDNAWNQYEEIYARSWKPTEGSPAFLRRFAQEEGAAGRLRFGLALADGKAVAAQFWTVEHGTAFIHKLAHDESAKALSPGTILTAALMQQVIDQDHVSMVDFGTGDDGYKKDWMEQVRPRYRIEAFRPLWPGNWPALAKLAIRKLVSTRPAG